MEPTIGRTVLFKITEDQAKHINQLRTYSAKFTERGPQAHIGNPAYAGEEYPLVIVRVWPNEFGDKPGVNGQVFLDGNDSLWITSAAEGTENGQWRWPTIVK